MPRVKNSETANKKPRRSRSCRNKDVILSSSDRILRGKVKPRSEKSPETVKCSTPVKSSPNSSSRESFGSDRENLLIPLSPISACSNTRSKGKVNSKKVKKCSCTTRKPLDDIFDGNYNAGEPKWKENRRRTYSRTGETSSDPSSPELKDPFSLFSSPSEHQPKCTSLYTSPAKISKPKCKKLDKKFEKEFQDWCKQFSEDLEVAAQTELIIE